MPAQPPAAAFPRLAAVNVRALFEDAQRLAAEAQHLAADAAETETRDLAAKTRAAQDSLCAEILANTEPAVRAAASAGLRSATVMLFQGADMHDGLCCLHLLKGPRDPGRRRQLSAHGFEPLLMRLRRELAPFRVVHCWDQATNANSVNVEF